jgi:hypothetical protein
MGGTVDWVQLLIEPGYTNDTLRISVSVLRFGKEQSNRQMDQGISGPNSPTSRMGV